MTPEFFDEFLPLWDQFESVLRESYIKCILKGELERTAPAAHVLSSVYSGRGQEFWWSRGIGASWRTRFEEFFFEKRHYRLERKLFYYDELDALAANDLQGKTGSIARFWGKRDRAETLYAQALKPCLDVRKQELLDGFRELAQELSQPIPYPMDLPLDGNVIPIPLEFQSKRR
ncbi:MAG: hypothetical protein ACI4XW_07255, partial [Candidatus Spyradocola sp.]